MLQSQPYAGIDLHRRRSTIVQRSRSGETLAATQVANDDVLALSHAVTAAGESPEVEAAQRRARGTKLRADFARIATSHGETLGGRKVTRRGRCSPSRASPELTGVSCGRRTRWNG